MRKYLAPAAVVATVLTVFLAGIAVAQSGALAGLAQPVVVSIEQLVPVDVTLALPQDDGSVITTTAPLTVGVSLQIKIDGNQVVAVAPAAEAEPAEVAVATATPAPADEETSDEPAADGETVDTAGRPYTVQAPDGLVLTQVTSKDSFGSITILGQLENESDTTYKFILISAPLYDAEGSLLDVGGGFATAQELEPGDKTAFTVVASAATDDVASYDLQVEAQK